MAEPKFQTEEWRPVVGFEGAYEVSSAGSVRSVGRQSTYRGTVRTVPGSDLIGDRGGRYRRVQLCRNGKARKHLAHRLVAQAFIENPHKHPVVNHKDGNRHNNSALNLEWCSHRDNVVHSFEVLGKGLSPILVFSDAIGFWYPSQTHAIRDGFSTVAQVLRGHQRRSRGFFVEYAEGAI